MKNARESCGRFPMMAVWISAFLMTSGCSLLQTERPQIPALEPRAEPQMRGDTYRDMADHALHLREAFLSCEADKKAAQESLK
jgi:hypothetical protein